MGRGGWTSPAPHGLGLVGRPGPKFQNVIKTVDYIIDLGPEGGHGGGQIMGVGTPEDFVKTTQSHTSAFLKQELQDTGIPLWEQKKNSKTGTK